MPRWSPTPMLVTIATSQRSKAKPSRKIPPRAVSNTAASTSGCSSTLRALRGPLQSPVSMQRCSMYTPSELVMPTRFPLVPSKCAVRRTVVVLPLVPETATTGIRALSPAANMLEIMASPTCRGLPNDGLKCMRKPGAALISTMPARCSSIGFKMVSATRSTPAISKPTICAAVTMRAASSGCTSSVTSVALPPVLKLALFRSRTRLPFSGIAWASSPCVASVARAISSKRILVNAVA